MSQVSCYTLDLYCDNREHGKCKGFKRYDDSPITYCHEMGSVCMSMARNDGWLLKRDGGALCPSCSGKHKKWVRL